MSPKQRVIIYFGQLVKRLALELERWPGVLERLLLFHRTRDSVPSTHTGDPQLPVTTGLRGSRLSSGLNSHALSANTCKQALTHKGKPDKASKCLTRLGVKQDICASAHGCKMRRAISANVTHALCVALLIVFSNPKFRFQVSAETKNKLAFKFLRKVREEPDSN